MKVLDLDKFVLDENKVIIGGKEFDLTFIPSEYAFRLQDLMTPLVEMEKSGKLSTEDHETLMNLITDVLKLTDESTTVEWVKSQLNHYKLVRVLPRFINGIFGISKKNSEEDSNTST